MNIITSIGFLAAFCTTISFIPQVIQVVKTKETKGISLGMYIIFTFGIACWLTYGLFLGDWPMSISNSITLVLAGTVLGFKIKYG